MGELFQQASQRAGPGRPKPRPTAWPLARRQRGFAQVGPLSTPAAPTIRANALAPMANHPAMATGRCAARHRPTLRHPARPSLADDRLAGRLRRNGRPSESPMPAGTLPARRWAGSPRAGARLPRVRGKSRRGRDREDRALRGARICRVSRSSRSSRFPAEPRRPCNARVFSPCETLVSSASRDTPCDAATDLVNEARLRGRSRGRCHSWRDAQYAGALRLALRGAASGRTQRRGSGTGGPGDRRADRSGGPDGKRRRQAGGVGHPGSLVVASGAKHAQGPRRGVGLPAAHGSSFLGRLSGGPLLARRAGLAPSFALC